jgi:hypothetical protein
LKETLNSKRVTTIRCFFAATLLFAFSSAQAETTLIIPQIADGGAWLTTIVLTNTSASQTVVSLSFFQEIGGGNTSSWSLDFMEMTSAQAQSLVLAGGSSLFLHTLGTAANTAVGWAQLSETDASAPVVAYAIFTQRVPGRTDQDGTAPAAAAVSRILVPFNNTNGAVTSMAIANTMSASENISVGVRTASSTTQPSPITLPANGHTSFAFPTQFTATAGQSGLAEFYSSSGSFSILALTFQSGAFTTAPVYSVSGPPIIASSSGGGGGNIVAGGFTVAQVQVTLASSSGTSETIGGNFASYTPAEWQAPFAAPTFGPCGVLDTISPPANAPYSPDTYLDAGMVTVSGPNLPSGTNIPEATTQMGPSYDFRAATGTTLALGGTYTITGSGGTQIGPFSASATLPTSFTVTNWDAITSINRANGVTINWAGSGFGTVTIGVTGQRTDETIVISCFVPASLGTFSIPQGALAMLFPTQISTLAVSATTAPPPGTSAPYRSTAQTLVPSLVGGGQVNYGAIGGQISVLKSLPIQ